MTSKQQERPPIRRFLIGRSQEQCHIVIDDPQRTVSSVHAELFLDSMNRWYLLDRQSRNGTFINRGEGWVRFKQGFVEPGQKIAFCQIVRDVAWLIEQSQHPNPRVVGETPGPVEEPAVDEEEGQLSAPDEPLTSQPEDEPATQQIERFVYERRPDGSVHRVPVRGGGKKS